MIEFLKLLLDVTLRLPRPVQTIGVAGILNLVIGLCLGVDLTIGCGIILLLAAGGAAVVYGYDDIVSQRGRK